MDQKSFEIQIEKGCKYNIRCLKGKECYIIAKRKQVFNFILPWTSCKAGLRIIGGRDAREDEFPYIVRIEIKINETPEDTIHNYIQLCTGAALTSKWVLSAAHCVYVVEDFDMKNTFLRYNSYFPNNVGLLAPVLETILHPGHDRVTMKFDILLIRSTDIKVSRYGKVNAVDFKTLVGHQALTLGFGGTNASSFEKPLQVLKGMLTSCPEREYYTAQMICLVRECTVMATICGGDSGGPVVHPAGIVGVNSMSEDDCNENTKVLKLTAGTSASIISPISPVLDWIRNYCK